MHPFQARLVLLFGTLLTVTAPPATGAPVSKISDTAAKNNTPSLFNFFIQKVDVVARVQGIATSADISFTTRESAHGLVQISTKAANDLVDVTPAGQQPVPAFPPSAVTMSWNDGLGAKGTQHSFRMYGLAPKTTYYYVITAAGADGRTFRYWHSFSTARSVDLGAVGATAGKERSWAVLDALKEPAAKTPAVPALSQADLDALAAKGEVLADADPLAAELRRREPEGPRRRGFDIGMGAAEGHTAPGPGKQRIHDSLGLREQGGFDTAVGFSLERNRNAEFARVGAAIAKADPTVEKARTADPAVLYWLGFDIATGLFGDPALGAKGNTAVGPGSLRIRDALSAAGQRGFNAAVTFHLGRK